MNVRETLPSTGDGRERRESDYAGHGPSRTASRSPRWLWPILLAAVLAYGWFLVRHAASGVGGADSSGYANTARRLAAGILVDRPRGLDRLGLPDQAASWVIPMGFLPGPRPGTMSPLYPIGFPLHLALGTRLTGRDESIFWVSPMAAILCLVLAYLIGRELNLSPIGAAGASVAMAVWPTFVFQALQPMSDVVATFWCLAAILLALRARRGSHLASAGAGVAFGVALLVRPTDALLIPALFFALPRKSRTDLGFLAGLAPLLAALAAVNLRCYGRPATTGWQSLGLLSSFELSHFPPRFAYYTKWIAATLTPFVPIGWLALSAMKRVPGRDRALLLSWPFGFLAFYCFYGPYESFLFLRFLLPAIPALCFAFFCSLERLPRMRGFTVAPLVSAALLSVVLLVEIRWSRQIGILRVVAEEGAAYADLCHWADRNVPADGVIVADIASGALEYYTDRPYVRWNALTPERFAELRRKTEEQGQRFYALIFPGEEPGFAQATHGNWRRIGAMKNVGLWELPSAERSRGAEEAPPQTPSITGRGDTAER